MRRIILPGTFLLLVAALYFFWQHRFERSPEFPTCHLADLRAGISLSPDAEWNGPASRSALTLRADPARSGVATRLPLPIGKPVDFLHLRCQVSAHNLIPGKEIWQDGRAMIEWHSPGGGPDWENDPFGSAQFDQAGGMTEFVMRPERPPAIPVLRVENLGTSGEFTISTFEATVLRERMIWKIGRWILMVGWLAWALAWIRSRGKPGMVRSLLAAMVWLLMGVYFVVPGPWKCLRSFDTSFQIGEVATFRSDSTRSLSPLQSLPLNSHNLSPVPVKSVGKIPDKGDFTLRLKHYAENFRSVLHVFLLFGPTLAIACLVGRRSACSLAIILTLCVEAAQLSFGYGFDRVDVFDLACDGVGIAVALFVHRRLQRIFPRAVCS
ncbi:MAG: hypothetical protein RLZZ214_4204 [Verrucomicrobiota bacterium]|jgi:hypothetical protein